MIDPWNLKIKEANFVPKIILKPPFKTRKVRVVDQENKSGSSNSITSQGGI